MTIIVTGSIAVDHLSTFPGRFSEQLVPDALDRVSLSFLVNSLDVRRGGVAANIAFGLARLGLRPCLVAAAGLDFADYRSWLDRSGVDTASVATSTLLHTARFLCTTDADGNQIASFYSGAMVEARAIELRPVVDRLNALDLVVVSPNDPVAMLRHTEECRQRGYPFAADPSQQLATMNRDEIRALIEGATYLFTNEYEQALVLQKAEWNHGDVLGRVGAWVTTLAAKGVRIERAGEPVEEIPAVPVEHEVDPTGVGDGFRAGFLAGICWRLSSARSAQLGCALASAVLQTTGTQEYELRSAEFCDRLASVYGRPAADEIAARLAGLA